MNDTPCCRRCEYWLPATLADIAAADIAECLHPNSGIDYPPADHVCPHFSEDAHGYEQRPASTGGIA